MKKNAILLFLLLPLHTALATQRADSLLRALDQAIDNSRLYTQQKEMRIGKVKQMLQVPHLTPAQRYDINARLAQEYKSFMLDSAIRYTRQNVRIARASGTKEQYYASTLDLARLYSITNLFVEAADLLRGISPGELSTPLRIQYYETYRAFYNYYSMSDERDATHYHAIRDTLMHLYRPEENGYKILLAEQLQTAGRHREAQQVLTGLLAQARQEDGWRAVAAYLAGDAYARTQDYERQIEYFALSAIADSYNVAAAANLLWRIMTFYIPLIVGGLFYFFYKGAPKKYELLSNTATIYDLEVLNLLETNDRKTMEFINGSKKEHDSLPKSPLLTKRDVQESFAKIRRNMEKESTYHPSEEDLDKTMTLELQKKQLAKAVAEAEELRKMFRPDPEVEEEFNRALDENLRHQKRQEAKRRLRKAKKMARQAERDKRFLEKRHPKGTRITYDEKRGMAIDGPIIEEERTYTTSDESEKDDVLEGGKDENRNLH